MDIRRSIYSLKPKTSGYVLLFIEKEYTLIVDVFSDLKEAESRYNFLDSKLNCKEFLRIVKIGEPTVDAPKIVLPEVNDKIPMGAVDLDFSDL